jgi:hypothetical protein
MIFLDCYSLIKNQCDGRCQSMGMCPLCQVWSGELPEGTKMTRWLYFKYFLKCLHHELFIRRKSEKAMKDFMETDEGKKMIEDVVASIKKQKENRKKYSDQLEKKLDSLIV